MNRILPPVVVLAVLLSACGTSVTPPPTFTPVDVEATAAALASTSLAETLTAIPTTTPIPTDTPTSAPTIASTPVVTVTSTAHYLPWACNPDGNGMATLIVINSSGQDVDVTISSDLCLKEIRLGDGTSETVSVPIGNYSYSGYIGTQNGFGGSVFLSDSTHGWVLTVNPDSATMETP